MAKLNFDKIVKYIPFVLILALAVYVVSKPEEKQQEKQPEKPLVLSDQEKGVIELAVADGYIRFVPELDEIWVKPVFWNSLTYEAKQNLGVICAVHCANQKGTQLSSVNIMDDMSGKKLARWSKTFGFKVY